jgi:hypothetical protein
MPAKPLSFTSIKDKQVELDGGPDEGITAETKFYLVRLEGPKDYIDGYDTIDYVALCKVTKSSKKKFSDMGEVGLTSQHYAEDHRI